MEFGVVEFIYSKSLNKNIAIVVVDRDSSTMFAHVDNQLFNANLYYNMTLVEFFSLYFSE